MTGTTGDDTLYGGAAGDVLVGGDGDDRLDGGTGADRMIGGRGDDVYIVDSVEDRVWEFPDSGTDTIFSYVSCGLPAFVENAVLQGGASLSLAGNDAVNFLQGNDADNGIQGGGGNDVVFGLGGSDNLLGGGGDDYLDGGAGRDVLQGGAGYDLLTGGAGDDVFLFNQGEETGAVLDYEGWFGLYGDLLQFNGYGTNATLTYTGSDGLWRIDYVLEGAAMVDHLTLVGVTLLSAVDDYVFL